MDPAKLEIIYKISLIFAGIVGLFIPIIVAAVGVIFVRKNQKRKEEAEAKLAETQVKLTETQLDKIQKEAKEVISNIINEPTIKDITEGYQNLMANFKSQIEQLQTENKRLRFDFDLELKCLRQEIEELREQNKLLRKDLNSSEAQNEELKRKLDSFIKNSDKKNE